MYLGLVTDERSDIVLYSIILSSSLSIEPMTFSLVSIWSQGCECRPYLHHLGAFGGAVIVGVFIVIAVVTATP